MGTHLSGELVDAGVDYLTVTAHQSSAMERLAETCRGIAESQFYEDFVARPLSFSGYSGMQVGHVYFGERDDGCIVRLGSYVAQSHYHRVLALADNVTRIDLQATYAVNRDPSSVAQSHYRQMSRHARRFKRPPRLSMLVGYDGSRTVYSGSRASDRFGRIYDKGRESGLTQFAGCLRYEVEFKGARASRIATAVSAEIVSKISIANGVLAFFADRGAVTRVLAKNSRFPAIDIAPRIPAHHTDIEDMLKWLSMAVRPTVTRLVHRNLQGRLAQALGIPLQWVTADENTALGHLVQHENRREAV